MAAPSIHKAIDSALQKPDALVLLEVDGVSQDVQRLFRTDFLQGIV